MSTFRKIMITSFAVLALGAAAQAKGNGGGAGAGPAGGAEPGTVMKPTVHLTHANPTPNRRGKRPGRERPGTNPFVCGTAADPISGARCQWN